MKWLIPSFIIAIVFSLSSISAAHEIWLNEVVIRDPVKRERIAATPIHLRPYRPLHFYGNTVRRRHYRGSALPTRSDIIATFRGIAQ
jgi:hypothetical protein